MFFNRYFAECEPRSDEVEPAIRPRVVRTSVTEQLGQQIARLETSATGRSECSTGLGRLTADSLDPPLKISSRPTADGHQVLLAAGSIDEARRASAERTQAIGHRFRSVVEPSSIKDRLPSPALPHNAWSASACARWTYDNADQVRCCSRILGVGGLRRQQRRQPSNDGGYGSMAIDCVSALRCTPASTPTPARCVGRPDRSQKIT